jgi:MFS family permease
MKGWKPTLPRGLLALRSRDYRWYFVGHLTSQTGSWIEMTAVAWILYELTNSAVLLGLGGLCRAAPMILLGLVGGAVADRVPRRLLLILTESIMLVVSAIVGLLALTGNLQFWHLYLLSLTSGTLFAFSVPARQALFPELVPRSAMPSAVMLNSLVARGSGFIGPPIAGAALATTGYAMPFLLNAASFLAMLAALAAMHVPSRSPARGSARPSLRKDMMEGLHFIRRSPLLKGVLALELFAGLFGHNSALITIMARDVLHAGPQGLGLLLSALAAGALAGMLAMVLFHTERYGRVILIAGASYTLLLIGFGVSGSFALSLILLFAVGAADGVWGVARNTTVQLAVPNELRGRAMSVVFLATRGSTPLGHFTSGLTASFMGGPATIVLGAALIGAGVAATARRIPGFSSARHTPHPLPDAADEVR